MAHGKDSVISLDDTAGSPQDITTKVTNVTGIPGGVDMAENSTFGSEDKTYEGGLGDATPSIECVWDATLDGYIGNKTQWKSQVRTIVYGPAGGTTGLVRYTVEAFIQSVDIPAPVGDIIKATISLQATGAQVQDTYP